LRLSSTVTLTVQAPKAGIVACVCHGMTVTAQFEIHLYVGDDPTLSAAVSAVRTSR
jgi:hypothetical protein